MLVNNMLILALALEDNGEMAGLRPRARATKFIGDANQFKVAINGVNAGENVGQCAGVKVGHWRRLCSRQEGPARWAFLFRGVTVTSGLAAGLGLLEAVAVAVHFKDVDVVRQAVEERAGEALGAEHGCPVLERQV